MGARPQSKIFFETLRLQLTSSRLSRLAGLLSHYLYWNTVGHVHHERQLPESSKHSLLLTIHELWSTLEAGQKDSPLGVSFMLPATMITLKWAVERCLTIQYPKFMVDEDLCQQVIDRINVLFMRLFDPDCRYAHFGALSGTHSRHLVKNLELIQAAMGQSNTKRTLKMMNRATPLLRSLMKEGGCIDPRTRALMNRNDSEKHQPPQQNQQEQMENWKRVELYHVALKRLGPSLSEKGLAILTPAQPQGGTHALKGSQSTGALLHNHRQHDNVKLPPVGKPKSGKVKFAVG